MNKLIKIIENDNLDEFIKNFEKSKWKESITKIENYAGISKYNVNIIYNDCDVFKYAVHKNADKIFYYLLNIVDTDKHGDNYGWPLLAMALKNNRYDYGNAIIKESTFNAYAIYHINQFSNIESASNEKEHIELLFNYLNKFDKFDFKDSQFIKRFTNLICYNEDTYNRFNIFYQNINKNKNLSVLEIFNKDLNVLAQEVFYNNFKPFILDKLNDNELKELIKSTVNDSITYLKVFENENNQAQECLNYLIRYPELVQEHLNNNQVVFSYLPLKCIIFLEENNIDLWKRNKENISLIDYLIDNNNFNDEKTIYFLNKYPEKVYNYFKGSDKMSNIKKYCEKILLSKSLEDKKNIYKNNKI